MFPATRAGFADLETRFGSFLLRKVNPHVTDSLDIRARAFDLFFSNFQYGDSLTIYIRAIPGVIDLNPIPNFIDNQYIPTDRGMKLGTGLDKIQFNGFDTQKPSYHHRLGWQWAHYAVSSPMAWEITKGQESIVIGVIDSWDEPDHPTTGRQKVVDIPDLNWRDNGNSSNSNGNPSNSTNNLLVINSTTHGDGDPLRSASAYEDNHSNTVFPLAVAQMNNDNFEIYNSNLTFTDPLQTKPAGGMVGTCPSCKGAGFSSKTLDGSGKLGFARWENIPFLDFDFTLDNNGNPNNNEKIRRIAISTQSQGRAIFPIDRDNTWYSKYKFLIHSGIVAVAASGNEQIPSDKLFAPSCFVYTPALNDASKDYKIIAVGATQDGYLYNGECNLRPFASTWPGTYWTGNERIADKPPLYNFGSGFGSFLMSLGVNKFATGETRMNEKEKAHIDVCAPGVGILTLNKFKRSIETDENSGDMLQHYTVTESGTSQATPVVSGICGLMLSVNRYMGLDANSTTGFLNNIPLKTEDLGDGEELQRRVYNVVTFTADKIFDDGMRYRQDPQNTSDYIPTLAPGLITTVNGEGAYVIQDNDIMHRSWAQRMGFGRVNAYRAVAHAIGNKGAYEYTTSLNLPFATGSGNTNENSKKLMHFGNWVDATHSVYQAPGIKFTDEPAIYKNNNGKTLLNGSTSITLTVPFDCILAIDGIVTSESASATNSKAIVTSSGAPTTDPGKILITGYLENVNVRGRIKANELLITAGTTIPGGSGLSFRTHNTSTPFADNQVSEIYGVVTMKNNGTLEVYNNAGCNMQPGSEIKMQGNKNIYIRDGATLRMKSASTISGETGRKVIVESGGKLEVEGENVDIFTEVEVLDGGQFILKTGSSLRLDRFIIQSGGTMQCEQKSTLYLNKASTWGQYYPDGNFCYGKLLIEGATGNRVTIDGKRLNICGEIGQGASINILGDLTNTSKNVFKMKNADIKNVNILAVDAYTPDPIDNVSFNLSRYVTPQSTNNVGAYSNSEFRLSLRILPASAANPAIIARSVILKECTFQDPMTTTQFDALNLGGDYSTMATSKSGLELENYDVATVEKSVFKYLSYGLVTRNIRNFNSIENTFDNCLLGAFDQNSSVFACTNTFTKVQFGALFSTTSKAILNYNSFTKTELATTGISTPRLLYRSNTFTEFLNAINIIGGLANLSYRISPQGNYERFGQNKFYVSDPITTPYPNPFVSLPGDNYWLNDIWFDGDDALLWTNCGFNKFAINTTNHVSGFGPGRTLLDGSINFWQDPNNSTGYIRVPTGWIALPVGDLNQSIDPTNDACIGVSENTLCSQCQGFGLPPAYAAAGNGPNNTQRPKKGGEQLLTNILPDAMQQRANLSDELLALRNSDSIQAFITRILPSSNDEEFLLTGKYLYKGMAFERLGSFDSARSAYHFITALEHSSSDSLVAAWRLQWIDVETGNWDTTLTGGEAQSAFYQRVAHDLVRKRGSGSSSMNAVHPSQNNNQYSADVIAKGAATTQAQTSTTSANQQSTSGTEEDEEFNNANIICEQTVCKIKTFRIGRLYPQPVTNSTFTIEAESYENATNVKAELFSITGQKIATLWEGNLKKGASTISMTLNDIPAGSYIFYLKNNKGEVVDYNRLVVADGQK
jgi:hypothetical protein